MAMQDKMEKVPAREQHGSTERVRRLWKRA